MAELYVEGLTEFRRALKAIDFDRDLGQAHKKVAGFVADRTETKRRSLAGRFGAVGPGVALVCTEFFNMVVSSWWLHRQCAYRTPVMFLLRLLVPTGASVVVALLLSGHNVVLILAIAAAAYLATSAAVGPLRWTALTSLRTSLRASLPRNQLVT